MERKIFDGVLICSDLDNTLLYHDREAGRSYVPERARRAIEYFQENGGRFTLATGRFPRFAERELKGSVSFNAPTVTLNGAVIYDSYEDRVLFEAPIEDDIGRLTYDVIDSMPKLKHMYLQYDGGVGLCVCRAAGGGYDYINQNDPKKVIAHFDSREEFVGFFESKTVYKVLYVYNEEDSEEGCEAIAARLPDYAVSRSWELGVELQRADADKGHGTRRLAEMLGGIRLLVCVGDYENDISMIKLADIGYAVGNANPKVKAVADRITVAEVGGGAVAEIIEDLERELA